MKKKKTPTKKKPTRAKARSGDQPYKFGGIKAIKLSDLGVHAVISCCHHGPKGL